MSQKPVYAGSVQEYDKLPWNIKQYYERPPEYTKQVYGVTYGTKETPSPITKEQDAARVFYSTIGRTDLYQKGYPAPEVPEGYEVTGAKEVIPKQVYGVTYGTEAQPNPATPYVEFEVQEKPKPLGIGEMGYVATKVAEDVLLFATGQKDNPIVKTLVRAEMTLPYFAAGTVGTLESDILGIASIPTSIAESIRVGNLVYKPIFDVKTSPTVIGAVISLPFGGAEAAELQSRPLGYRLGAAFGEAGFIVLSSEATSAVWQRLRGVKVTKLAGAKEVEFTKGTGEGLETTRVTKLLIEEQQVSPSQAAKLREFSRYVNPERIALGGSQVRLEQYVDDTVRIASKSAEAFRESTPYLETAAKASATRSGLLRAIGEKVGLIKTSKTAFAGAVVKDYSDDLAKYSSQAVGVAQGGKGFVYSTEKIVASQAVYPYGRSVAEKTFTSAFVEGTIDTQVYLRLVKAVGPEVAQKWYPQMGGVATQILEKAAPKAVTVTTKVVAVSAPLSVGTRVAGAALSVIPKAILRETGKKTSIIAPITLETPQQKRKTPIIASTISKPSSTPNLADRVTSLVVQSPSQKPGLVGLVGTSPKQEQPQIPKIEIPQRQKQPTPEIPKFFQPSKPPLYPGVPRIGGSGGGARRSGGFSVGKWYKKKNPVATVEQNLRNVAGMSRKRAKSIGKLVSTPEKLVNKSFKFTRKIRSKSKKKRKRSKR